MTSARDLERAWDFMRRGDIAGSRVEPFAHGTAIFTPELPLRHDSNYLLVEREAAADELASDADRLQGGERLAHRAIVVPDDALGERLAPRFDELGWKVGRFVVMAHRREPERASDLGLVREVGEAALRGARERAILAQPWGSREVAAQLLAAKRRIPLETRFFAVLVEGDVASGADLYSDGETAQVEDVWTDPEHRNRGYASAVVLKAVEEARKRGASFVFLVCDAEDWPQDLYRRLGFDEIGRYYKFFRV
ncbi:MAG: GNAT family N-acetyltransferase [Actinomycetota bacterium]|nr:GNAT family N-acetyltransferase [Actinomycetota bacterium]